MPLIAGYTLYGINTLMLVLALREGELSMLYPIIALTYVWVTLLSYLLLKEKSNFYKNVGHRDDRDRRGSAGPRRTQDSDSARCCWSSSRR